MLQEIVLHNFYKYGDLENVKAKSDQTTACDESCGQ